VRFDFVGIVQNSISVRTSKGCPWNVISRVVNDGICKWRVMYQCDKGIFLARPNDYQTVPIHRTI